MINKALKTPESHAISGHHINTLNNNQEISNWLIDIVEPIDSKLNYYLSILPDYLELDMGTVLDIVCGQSTISHIDVYNLLHYLIKQKLPNEQFNIYADEWELLIECFEFNIIYGSTTNHYYNYMNNGTMRIVKTRSVIENEQLSAILGRGAIAEIKRMSYPTQEQLSRYNDIFMLFNKSEVELSLSSAKLLSLMLIETLQDIFDGNKWNIRSTDLANSIGKWIRSYIEDNDEEAYKNLLKLKRACKAGCPIYWSSLDNVE